MAGLTGNIFQVERWQPGMLCDGGAEISRIMTVGTVTAGVIEIIPNMATGIITLTKSAARELARHGINVNCISLGIVATEMTEKIRTDPKLAEIYMKRILLNRFAEGEEDIAPPFVFFASDDARYITGQVLSVDGGYGMT